MTRDMAATPIIIGVGDVQNRSLKPEDAVEPMQLMLRAVHKAIEDTGLDATHARDLQAGIDSVDVVRTWTWPYEDLPALLALNLGAHLTHKSYSGFGGNEVGRLIDEAARRVSQRKSKLAVVTGGEALASRMLTIKTAEFSSLLIFLGVSCRVCQCQKNATFRLDKSK